MEANTGKKPTDMSLSDVRTDGNTQSRKALDEVVVSEYAEAMSGGDQFPPVVAFHDGSAYWLADGFHRVMAASKAGLSSIPAIVNRGTRRDAVLYSVGSNAGHGLRRTNADKRLAVMMLLEDEEWSQWSDREIARRCAVHNSFVSRVRASLSTSDSDETGDPPPPRTYTTKHGTEAEMRTENIGNTPRASPDHSERHSAADTPPQAAQSRGDGLKYAHKAIEALSAIPYGDGLRGEAFDEVARWIEYNR